MKIASPATRYGFGLRGLKTTRLAKIGTGDAIGPYGRAHAVRHYGSVASNALRAMQSAPTHWAATWGRPYRIYIHGSSADGP
jgi:hypothetical protein